MQRSISLIESPTDTSMCFIACVRMVLESMWGQSVSWEEAKSFCDYRSNRETWVFYALARFASMGCKVRYIDRYDPEAFTNAPDAVLRQTVSAEDAEGFIQRTDIDRLRKSHEEFVASSNAEITLRVPTTQDIRELVRDGWYTIPTLNYWSLHNIKKYSPHAVLAVAVSNDNFNILDPGPPAEERWLSEEKLMTAWYTPSSSAASLIAIKHAASH